MDENKNISKRLLVLFSDCLSNSQLYPVFMRKIIVSLLSKNKLLIQRQSNVNSARCAIFLLNIEKMPVSINISHTTWCFWFLVHIIDKSKAG